MPPVVENTMVQVNEAMQLYLLNSVTVLPLLHEGADLQYL